MKVLGYAPSLPGPFVPKFILTPNGLFDRDGHPADGQAISSHEFDIGEHEWIGVLVDGTIETFKRSDEKAWCARASQLAVVSIEDPKKDPEGTLRTLRAAADIIGFDLPTLMQKIEQAKKPGESIVDTWTRIKDQ
jgi:hypothetical protein